MAEELVLEADHRERGSAAAGAPASPGARVDFVSLKAGDFRKSTFDGRLSRQSIRMTRSSPWPRVLVKSSKFPHPTVRGARVIVGLAP